VRAHGCTEVGGAKHAKRRGTQGQISALPRHKRSVRGSLGRSASNSECLRRRDQDNPGGPQTARLLVKYSTAVEVVPVGVARLDAASPSVSRRLHRVSRRDRASSEAPVSSAGSLAIARTGEAAAALLSAPSGSLAGGRAGTRRARKPGRVRLGGPAARGAQLGGGPGQPLAFASVSPTDDFSSIRWSWLT
jgi:hypothetical protein